MFTQQEISTICLFFGVANVQPGNSLGDDHFFLEPSEIVHPVGDRLAVEKNGFIVTISGETLEKFYFQRDFAGLVAALERLTLSVA